LDTLVILHRQDTGAVDTGHLGSRDDVGMNERFTVAGLIRAIAEERPADEMLSCAGERRSWAEQLERSATVANALLAEGVGAGDRIAFLDRNGLAYFDLLFGSALIGAVDVAVNWRLAPGEIEAVVNDSDAAVLVVGTDYLPAVRSAESGLPSVRRIVVVGEDDLAEADRRGVGYGDWLAASPGSSDPGHRGAPGDVSVQLYTSGTTGLPKGVMLTNDNLATAVGAAGTNFRIDETTVSLVAMPLFHIGGSGWALSAMSRGGRSVILRDVDPGEILRLFEAERITETFVVPAVLMFLLQTPEIAQTDLSSLRNIFYGASPISEEVLVQCMKRFPCDFTQVYGMTETTGAITALRPEDHDPTGPRRRLLRSAGRPHEGVELRVVRPDGEPAQPGEVGEVVTRSAFNMLGYWRRDGDTAATIDESGWLHTGDAGYLDEDGYLFLYDRMKDMIVTGGENVYPADVENALLSHPGIADAAVIGVPDETWGESVTAVVVLAPPFSSETLPPADIISYCHERLAGYKCPKSVLYRTTLPRNPSGKILKREIREEFWTGRDRRIS
jgi:acyl-CoA synthetase (AMP-forming)/AMP-acid ligase II